MMVRIILLVCLIANIKVSGQWQEISYSESLASGHNDLYFLSNDTGYIAGTELIDSDIKSYILRTYDGGLIWDTTFVDNKIFKTIHFPTITTGYIAFVENNRIGVAKTSDSGNSWSTVADSILVANPVSVDITFFDQEKGILSMQAATYITYDGGLNWELLEDYPMGGSGRIQSYNSYYGDASGSNFIYSIDQCESVELYDITDEASGLDLTILDSEVAISYMGQEGGFVNDYPYFNFARLIFGSFNDLEFLTVDIPTIRSVTDIEYGSESVLYGLSALNEFDGPRIIKSVDSGITWYEQGLEEGAEFYYSFHKNLQCLNDTVCYIAFGNVIYKTTNGGGPLLDPIESIVLSTENPISEIEFNVFPNPSTGHLTLESEGSLENISVFDSLGKLVFQESLKNRIRHALNLSHLPKGLYLIRVSGDGFEKTEKVVLE